MLKILKKQTFILTVGMLLIFAGHFSRINANFTSDNYLNTGNSEITSGFSNEYEIEHWMADAGYWNLSPFFEAGEPATELVDWMADVLHWNYSEAYHAEENDVTVENWMIDTGRWNSSFNKCANLPRPVIDETPVYVNDWMMDISRWRKES